MVDRSVHITQESPEELLAARFILTYPPCLTLPIDDTMSLPTEDYMVLIVGWNPLSIEILKKIITMGQFEKTKFKAYIVDERENMLPKMLNNFCEFDVSLNYLPFDSKDFLDFLLRFANQLNQIILCLPQKSINLRLQKQMNAIFLNIGRNRVPKVLIADEESGLVETDTDTRQQYGIDTIELLARQIYSFYHPERKNWDRLDRFQKNMNRDAALHIFTKLYLVGLDVCKKENINNRTLIHGKTDFYRYLTKKNTDMLSRLEHRRWCSFYYLEGWRTLPLSEDNNLPKDTASCRHACLVDWDTLDEVSQRYQVDYKKKDEEQVLNIINFIHNIGLEVVVNRIRDKKVKSN